MHIFPVSLSISNSIGSKWPLLPLGKCYSTFCILSKYQVQSEWLILSFNSSFSSFPGWVSSLSVPKLTNLLPQEYLKPERGYEVMHLSGKCYLNKRHKLIHEVVLSGEGHPGKSCLTTSLLEGQLEAPQHPQVHLANLSNKSTNLLNYWRTIHNSTAAAANITTTL